MQIRTRTPQPVFPNPPLRPSRWSAHDDAVLDLFESWADTVRALRAARAAAQRLTVASSGWLAGNASRIVCHGAGLSYLELNTEAQRVTRDVEGTLALLDDLAPDFVQRMASAADWD